MVREIVLDTETTGMDPLEGDRIVEIGAIELLNHLPTGRTLQIYINPEREVPAEAIAVHGITNEFLADKPIFSQIYTDFIDFIGHDSTLVIHNAAFDMKFINWELEQVGHPPLPWNRVIDSLTMARKQFPGSPANLDALCRRFKIDNSERSYHGALLDSELLAEVYLELLGGRQRGLALSNEAAQSADTAHAPSAPKTQRPYREPRPHDLSQEERDAHNALLDTLDNALWRTIAGGQ